MNPKDQVVIAGSETLAGRALASALQEKGFSPIKIETNHLTDLHCILQIFQEIQPDFVFLTAGKSGGIQANQKYPATFMRNNLLAELQVLEAARIQGVEKLLFLSSSCVYPKNAPQPMVPSHLLTSSLEPTSQPYALAKLSGIELCSAYRQEYGSPFISVIPSDPFGPEGSFDAENSHVIASLIVKMHRAKMGCFPSVILWGSGTPVRDFIFSRDLAEGCLYLMEHYQEKEPINLTANHPLSIRALAEIIREEVGFLGKLVFDASYPDGTPSKVLDSKQIFDLGWKPSVLFQQAVRQTYEAYLKTVEGEAVHA